MATSNFADRFFWARHRSGMGAPAIASAIGCGQALIFSIEKTNAKSSKYNDKFAKLFGVDRNWLRTGEPPAPEGFDPVAARREREAGSRRGGTVVQFADFSAGEATSPRWMERRTELSGMTNEQRGEILQRQLINDFQDYSKIVGAKATRAFIELLNSMANLMVAVPTKETERDGD